MRRMLSTASAVRGSAPIRRDIRGAARDAGDQPRQHQRLQRSAPVENDVIKIDRMQRGAVHIVADRIHLRGPPSLMMAMPRFGFWVAMVPASTRFALLERRVVRVLRGRVRRRRRRTDAPRPRSGRSPPGADGRRADAVSDGLAAIFTARPRSATAMRASSTAMSAASAIETALGPLPCRRDSHSFVRVSACN